MPPYKPYVSDAQRRWANSPSGVAALGREDVEGKNKTSKGSDLPDYVHNGKPEPKSLMGKAFRRAARHR